MKKLITIVLSMFYLAKVCIHNLMVGVLYPMNLQGDLWDKQP
jgi:hypothetical protein